MSDQDADPTARPAVFIALTNPDLLAGHSVEGLRAAGLTLETPTSGADLLRAFNPDVPSCTLLDILLPPSGGLDILVKLRRRRWSTPILAVGEAPSTRVAVEAMRLGADDVLEPPLDPHLLHSRVLQLIERDAQAVAAERACAERRRRIGTLSRRERQVLDYVLQGMSSKEIARLLGVSPKAIDIYRAGMMRKLGQRSAVAVARWVSSCPRCAANPSTRGIDCCFEAARSVPAQEKDGPCWGNY